MTVSITQLQALALTAPALLALLLVPGVTLGHPVLIARAIIPVVAQYAAEPAHHSDIAASENAGSPHTTATSQPWLTRASVSVSRIASVSAFEMTFLGDAQPSRAP